MKKIFIYLAGLILLSLILYFPTLQIGFLSDDWGYVYLANHTTFWHSLSFLFSPDKWGNGLGNYRPIQSIMTVLAWQANPIFLHFLSIVLHGMVSFFVGYLAYVVFQKKNLAVVASLVFLFFPLNTEVVVWLASWNSLLATIPLLLALILYAKRTPSKIVDYVVLVVLLFFSILAKEHALVFPFFLIGIDLLKKRKIGWKNFFIFSIFIALYFALRLHVLGKLGGYVASDNSPKSLELSLHNISLYAKLPLAFVYNFFNSDVTPKVLTIFSRALLLIAILVSFFKIFYKNNSSLVVIKNLLVFGALVYIAHSIGWNLFNPTDIHNEHSRLLYTANIWFALAIGYIYSLISNYKIRYFLILYIVLLPVLVFYQYKPWIKAGEESQAIVKKVESLLIDNSVKEISIENLPDSYKGAFVFRNGIEFVVALESKTEKNQIFVSKTMQDGLEKEVTIKSLQE